jgi:hypothetical protein
MKTLIHLVALSFASLPSLHASTNEASVLESAREEITNETIQDLRDYPHYRYLPSERFGLFARCVAEKRIQVAKTIDCDWTDESRPVTYDRLERFLQCLAGGGFGEDQRERHREFCAFLMREQFRAVESDQLGTRPPSGW